MSTWLGRTVHEIAAAVRDGTVSPATVLAEHLDQIDRLDARVGAFVRVRHDQARAEAQALAARDDLAALPLAGVPLAIKDNIPVAGEPTRFGTTAASDVPAPSDHEVVRRLRAAGAVVVGTTRMPELGAWATSEDAAGAARNPWSLERTPGGSSGGSAAAVAAAMVPAAHGNDGLGSIRIPAACCGLVGLKPGPGLVPADLGHSSWLGLAENGPLATTVEDAALLLSVMADRPELAQVRPPTGRLLIATSTFVPLPGVRIDPQIVKAVTSTAATLRDAGHVVSRTDPPYTLTTANSIFTWYAAAVAEEAEGLDAAQLEPRQRRQAQLGRTLHRLGRVREADRDRWRRTAAQFFSAHDLLLTPVMTTMPPTATGWRNTSWAANVWHNTRWVPYPGAWNFAGYPAITVPVAMHSTGLPIGLQFVAPPGREALLLSVARQLQAHHPWPRHAPLAREG